jgi:hypothetical protein
VAVKVIAVSALTGDDGLMVSVVVVGDDAIPVEERTAMQAIRSAQRRGASQRMAGRERGRAFM